MSAATALFLFCKRGRSGAFAEKPKAEVFSVRPFLKWAGNKYQIVDRIKEQLKPGKRLIEPFVGSGAVFLNTDYRA